MEIVQDLLNGFAVAMTPTNLAFALIGTVVGTLIGALPGIGPVSGVAMLLPLTFGMNPTTAIIMLSGIYYGCMYGGTITSVLINTPGEAASVVTTLDGYQMALKGRAGPALGIAAIGSFIAGTFGIVMLMLLGKPLAGIGLQFGPPEYFALMLFGLAALSGLTGDDPLKGAISVLVGLGLATVGMDLVSGRGRFTFGIAELSDGVDFLPVAIGLFGLGEVLSGQDEAAGDVLNARISLRDVWPTAQDWIASRWAIVRGSVLGFAIGLLPGAGAAISSFIAYAVEKRFSKHPEKFGTGVIEGVAAPEAANNSHTAGAMVPLLTLGLPSSPTAAILLGAFIMWGLRPGPQMFTENPEFVWGLIASMYIGNVMLVIMNLAFIPLFVRALRIPYTILMPLIVVLCIVGAFSQRNSVFDIGIALVFGVLGYVLRRLSFPMTGLVLGLVIGPMMENALRQSLILSSGSPLVFVSRPISATFVAGALLVAALPIIKATIGRIFGRPPAAA